MVMVECYFAGEQLTKSQKADVHRLLRCTKGEKVAVFFLDYTDKHQRFSCLQSVWRGGSLGAAPGAVHPDSGDPRAQRVPGPGGLQRVSVRSGSVPRTVGRRRRRRGDGPRVPREAVRVPAPPLPRARRPQGFRVPRRQVPQSRARPGSECNTKKQRATCSDVCFSTLAFKSPSRIAETTWNQQGFNKRLFQNSDADERAQLSFKIK